MRTFLLGANCTLLAFVTLCWSISLHHVTDGVVNDENGSLMATVEFDDGAFYVGGPGGGIGFIPFFLPFFAFAVWPIVEGVLWARTRIRARSVDA